MREILARRALHGWVVVSFASMAGCALATPADEPVVGDESGIIDMIGKADGSGPTGPIVGGTSGGGWDGYGCGFQPDSMGQICGFAPIGSCAPGAWGTVTAPLSLFLRSQPNQHACPLALLPPGTAFVVQSSCRHHVRCSVPGVDCLPCSPGDTTCSWGRRPVADDVDPWGEIVEHRNWLQVSVGGYGDGYIAVAPGYELCGAATPPPVGPPNPAPPYTPPIYPPPIYTPPTTSVWSQLPVYRADGLSGGPFLTNASAMLRADGALRLFYRSDNPPQIIGYVDQRTDGTWGITRLIDGATDDAPALVVDQRYDAGYARWVQDTHLYVRGGDDRLWYAFGPDGAFGGGGSFHQVAAAPAGITSAPTAVVDGRGLAHIVYRDQSARAAFVRVVGSSAISSALIEAPMPSGLPLATEHAPAAARAIDGRVRVIAVAQDAHLYETDIGDDGATAPWRRLPPMPTAPVPPHIGAGHSRGGPVAVTDGAGGIRVYYQGADAMFWELNCGTGPCTEAGSAWQPVTPPPGAVPGHYLTAMWDGSSVRLFALDSHKQLYSTRR